MTKANINCDKCQKGFMLQSNICHPEACVGGRRHPLSTHFWDHKTDRRNGKGQNEEKTNKT